MLLKIHFIWYQGITHMPQKYKDNINEFIYSNSNNIQVALWSSVELESILFHSNTPEIFRTSINNCKYLIQKIDIYKWLLLYTYGGLYLDLDIKINMPLDSHILSILKSYDMVLNYMQIWSLLPYNIINNGIIYSIKGNTIILEILNSIRWDSPKYKNKDWIILDTTGPFSLNHWYLNYSDKNKIHILPSSYFEGRALVNFINNDGIYTTHLHHNNWMDNWLLIYILAFKNIFYIIVLICIVAVVYKTQRAISL